ncbi:dipicolinate synthase subunit DpsA [Tissierella sp.]|uniref:dipicolinate synthase subunit DpsA n=1 Tax=Tissierella sp. TaxID=41274 RepID=UPI002865F6FD|nr:dipicolinate synthase subunit DpsA [Tissierella sp.]MDR7855788.1 dipicolinate synthase subunit DpsA [Tissierella sp.]
MKIAVIGGDKRSIGLAKMLWEDGHDIKVFGFNKLEDTSLNHIDDMNLAIKESETIIGPLPCSKDNIILNTPFNLEEILLEEVFSLMESNQIFIGGKITEKISDIAGIYNISTIDLLEREEMAVLNAIPTAEGAIQVAMENIDITLHGSNIMILGFGRIGKILAKMLHGIGSNVFVEARNHTDLAWISSYGYIPIHLDSINDYIHNMDVVFNTIPTMVLGENLLVKMKKESLIVDLASIPGGIDFKKAEELEIKTIWALGLPGKVAPITAAKVMKETIYNIVGELEG